MERGTGVGRRAGQIASLRDSLLLTLALLTVSVVLCVWEETWEKVYRMLKLDI